MIRAKTLFPDQVTIFCFDDLIEQPEQAMRMLSDRLEIDYHECLLKPSFNGYLIESSSNFFKGQPGQIDKTATSQHLGQIETEDSERISELCSNLYQDCLALVDPV